jgi:PAS domain S-box-containing protein
VDRFIYPLKSILVFRNRSNYEIFESLAGFVVSGSFSEPINASDKIRIYKESIIKIWDEKFCQHIPAAKSQSSHQLHDSIPKFLDQLAEAVDSARLRANSYEEVNNLSQDHGEQRSSLPDYSLHQMLREYQYLRESIFEVLEKVSPITKIERDIILSTIEQGMAEAAYYFVSKTNRVAQLSKITIEGVKDHAIIVTDLKGIILEWNSGAEHIFNYTQAEMIGKNVAIIFTPEDLAKNANEEEMDTAIRHSKAEDKRWHLKKDCTRFFANGIMNPLIDTEGSVYGFVKVLKDDTERIKIEEEKRLAKEEVEKIQQRFDVATLTSLIGVWEYYITTDTAWRSLSHDYLHGFSEPVSEWSFDKALSLIHPDDRCLFKKTFEESMSTKKNWRIDYRIILPDKTERWVVADGNFIRNEEDVPYKVIGTTIDITSRKRAELALKESEERFWNLANALPQIIWTATSDFYVDWYNDWWYKYLDLPPGTKWDDEEKSPMHPDDVRKTRPKLLEAVQTGQDFNMEQRFRRGSDGEYRWHLVRGVPLKDVSGKIIKWVGANIDIHDQKLIVKKLEEERDLRERFVSTLSHDLRTPLTAAKISAQVLARKIIDNPPLFNTAHKISVNMDRADRMIKDLLDASLITVGEQLPLKLQTCKLRSLIEEVVEEQAMVHGDRFLIVGEDDLEGYYDQEALKRILENLLSNAIKYGHKNKQVTIYMETSKCSNLIKVHNEGNEISEQDQAKLFEQYRRAESAKAGDQKGWGLGLTLVKGIVEAHQGNIRLESSLEAGTTFIVSLPRKLDLRS